MGYLRSQNGQGDTRSLGDKVRVQTKGRSDRAIPVSRPLGETWGHRQVRKLAVMVDMMSVFQHGLDSQKKKKKGKIIRSQKGVGASYGTGCICVDHVHTSAGKGTHLTPSVSEQMYLQPNSLPKTLLCTPSSEIKKPPEAKEK